MEEKKDILENNITSGFKQEAPSFDFTEIVMKKIELSVTEKKIVEPLISKKAWSIIIGIAILVVLSSFSFEIQKIELHLFDNFSLSKISDFIVTIKLFLAISLILVVMTVFDLFYRKTKQLA